MERERPRRGDPIGLCARCVHARQVPTAHTVYWMCQRSATDPRYDKYPRLPIIACEGFETGPPVAGSPPPAPADPRA